MWQIAQDMIIKKRNLIETVSVIQLQNKNKFLKLFFVQGLYKKKQANQDEEKNLKTIKQKYAG